MTERISIREIHKFQGKFPVIPTNHPQVDEQALLIGDTDPLYLNLPIAEMGRRSDNGIWYDEALVKTIAEQLPGLGGGRGHIPEGQEDSAFPLEEVFWIGNLLDDHGVLWAKGYVPPGRTREFIIRKKASGGAIATSIYGKAIKEMDQGKRGFRLRDLVMEYVDLAPSKRASLKNPRGFELTREMSEGETPMPEKADIIREFTVADIALLPQSVREAVISDAKLRVDATRVSELETRNQQLEQQVKEMREYATLNTNIRAVVGPEVDIVAVITEMQHNMTGLRKLLGSNVNVVTTVEEMYNTIGEMRREKFTRAVDDKVVEMTPWNVSKEEDKLRVQQFRNNLKHRLVSEISGDPSKLAETAQRVWGSEFQLIAETMVQSFAGPAAMVGGKSPANNSPVETLKSEAGVNALLEKFGRK